MPRFFPPRKTDVRKGDFGRVIIAGGSDRYVGCLFFNAMGSLRAGADLAIVVAPKPAADAVRTFSPDIISIPCNSEFPDPKVVSEALEDGDALVVGGGVKRNSRAHVALRTIIRNCQKPMVIDAEALHAITSKPQVVLGKTALLTPHPGEYMALTGKTWPRNQSQRRAACQAVAKHYRATVIVKGALDFVSDGRRVHVDRAGSPFLTKGGYGDILAGVASAHLARGRTPFDAAIAAAFIVGRAGEKAAKLYGEGTLASDTLEFLSSVVPHH